MNDILAFPRLIASSVKRFMLQYARIIDTPDFAVLLGTVIICNYLLSVSRVLPK
jgi:hypothetical protein